MKGFVNWGLLFAFPVLAVTGAMRFFRPFDLTVTRVHIVFGALIVVLVALHLAARLSYFGRSLRSRRNDNSSFVKRMRVAFIPFLVCFYLMVAAIWDFWPASGMLAQGFEAKNSRVIFRPDSEVAVRESLDSTEIKRRAPEESSLTIELEWGPAFETNSRFLEPFQAAPTQVAVWAESSNGTLIETFFVSEESAYSEHAEWAGRVRQRVEILPIWRRRFTMVSGVEPDGEIDAFSGATPEHSFSIENYLSEDPEGFYVCVEVNAPRDANDSFNSNQAEDSEGYTPPGIGQPSVYYSAFVDPSSEKRYYLLDLVGHGEGGGQSEGGVYYGVEGLTSAKRIVEKILVHVDRP